MDKNEYLIMFLLISLLGIVVCGTANADTIITYNFSSVYQGINSFAYKCGSSEYDAGGVPSNDKPPTCGGYGEDDTSDAGLDISDDSDDVTATGSNGWDDYMYFKFNTTGIDSSSINSIHFNWEGGTQRTTYPYIWNDTSSSWKQMGSSFETGGTSSDANKNYMFNSGYEDIIDSEDYIYFVFVQDAVVADSMGTDFVELEINYTSANTTGQTCNIDGDCDSGNCDADLSGVKRCHPNATSCVRGEGGSERANEYVTCENLTDQSKTCNSGTWEAAVDCADATCTGASDSDAYLNDSVCVETSGCSAQVSIDCSECQTCSTGSCVSYSDNTQDTTGANTCSDTCKNCDSGSCVDQASTEDLFNQCPSTCSSGWILSGNCDGSGACNSTSGICSNNFACNDATSCLSSCNEDGSNDCFRGDYYCVSEGNSCQQVKNNGEVCTDAAFSDDNYACSGFNCQASGYCNYLPRITLNLPADNDHSNTELTSNFSIRDIDGTNLTCYLDAGSGTTQIWSPTQCEDSGIISHWKFNGDATDSVGSNDGSVTGATLTTGKYGQAYEFDGLDDYIYVPHNDILNITGDITLSVWIKTNDNSNTQFIVNKRTASDAKSHYGFRISGGDEIEFYITDSAGSQKNLLTTGNIIDDEWHNVVAKYDNADMTIYLDGNEVAAKNEPNVQPYSTNSRSLLIGQRGWGSYPQWFNGSIDEVMIFNKALTAYQIKAIYQNSNHYPCSYKSSVQLSTTDLIATGDGDYAWNITCNDTWDSNVSVSRTYVLDSIRPDLIWGWPLQTNTSHTNSDHSLDLKTNDLHLFRVMANVTNTSGHQVHLNYSGDIDQQWWNISDTVSLTGQQDQNFTIHFSAVDDSTYSRVENLEKLGEGNDRDSATLKKGIEPGAPGISISLIVMDKNKKVKTKPNQIKSWFEDVRISKKLEEDNIKMKPRDFFAGKPIDQNDYITEYRAWFEFRVRDAGEIPRLKITAENTEFYHRQKSGKIGHVVWGDGEFYSHFDGARTILVNGIETPATLQLAALNSTEAIVDVYPLVELQKNDIISIDPATGGTNNITETATFTYDTTAPSWSNNDSSIPTAPEPGDIVTFSINYTDDYLDSVTLYFTSNESTQTVTNNTPDSGKIWSVTRTIPYYGVTYYWNWSAADTAGNIAWSDQWSFTVTNQPYMNQITLSPSVAYSNNTLLGYCNASDEDGGTIRFYYSIYKNDTLNTSGLSDYKPINKIHNIINVSSSYTQKGQAWKLGCIANDGLYNSSQENSSEITILNSRPVFAGFNVPQATHNYSGQINFTWPHASDIDGDTLYYNLSIYNSDMTLNKSIVNLTTMNHSIFNSLYISEGEFRLNISIYDGENSVTSLSELFRIDNSPPVFNSNSTTALETSGSTTQYYYVNVTDTTLENVTMRFWDGSGWQNQTNTTPISSQNLLFRQALPACGNLIRWFFEAYDSAGNFANTSSSLSLNLICSSGSAASGGGGSPKTYNILDNIPCDIEFNPQKVTFSENHRTQPMVILNKEDYIKMFTFSPQGSISNALFISEPIFAIPAGESRTINFKLEQQFYDDLQGNLVLNISDCAVVNIPLGYDSSRFEKIKQMFNPKSTLMSMFADDVISRTFGDEEMKVVSWVVFLAGNFIALALFILLTQGFVYQSLRVLVVLVGMVALNLLGFVVVYLHL